jgi:O-antigen/teichoic acid export membrane protein
MTSKNGGMQSFWNKIIYAVSSRIIQLLISVATLSLSARWLGTEGRGLVMTTYTWVLLFATFGALSLGQVVMNRASNDQSGLWFRTVFGELLFSTIVFSIISWTTAVVCAWLFRGEIFSPCPPLFLVIGFTALPFIIWDQYQNGLFSVLDRIDTYNHIQILGRLTGTILVVFLWLLDASAITFLISIGITQLVIALTGLTVLWTYLGGAKPTIASTSLRKLVTDGVTLHWDTIGTFVLYQTDVLIISHFVGTHEAGLYQFVLQLIFVVLVISYSTSAVTYGQLGRIGARRSWKYQRIAVGLTTAFLGIVFILISFLSSIIVQLAGGPAFADAAETLRIMSIAIFGMNLTIVMGPQWIGRGLFKALAKLTMLLAILKLSLSFLIVPRYGIIGAAWLTSVIFLIALCAQLVFAAR